MEDRDRIGARLLALAGLWLLVTGLLLAMSFVIVALISLGALLLVALIVGGRILLERAPVGETVSTGLVAGGRAGRETLSTTLAAGRRAGRGLARRARGFGFRHRLTRLGLRLREAAARAPGRADRALTSALRTYAAAVYRGSLLTSRLVRRAERLNGIGKRRQAIKLNERGVQLRRRGQVHHAVEQHRVALEIIRDLGDEQAEAMTLNSLALALAQGGAEQEAVEHLEQARTVLHELGDEEHEGQVLANLGLVYRRQGSSDEAAVLFQEALDRLPPDSWEYRQVEEELQRAS